MNHRDNTHKETKAIRDQLERTAYREHSVPMYLTSSFTFENAEQMRAMFANELEGDVYSRFGNPNTQEFILKMCALEKTESGFATSTGMAAVWASIAGLLNTGDHILASRAVFGSTHQILTQILPRFNISYTYVEPDRPDTWKQNIQNNTRMILLETPSNPGLKLIDLEKAGKLSKEAGLILNVDNCFATPYLQNPADYGADIITHSATKYIDGQGRVLGGIVLGNPDLMEKIVFFCRHTGPSLSPFNAWLLSKSLETLQVRMERHCKNALQLAQYLETRPDIDQVLYPHLPSHPQYELATRQMSMGGGIVTFVVSGGIDRGIRFLNAIQMLSMTANLGDSRSIVTHPASTTHSKLSEEERQAVGITPGLIRISVGLEYPDDIIKDVKQALDNTK